MLSYHSSAFHIKPHLPYSHDARGLANFVQVREQPQRARSSARQSGDVIHIQLISCAFTVNGRAVIGPYSLSPSWRLIGSIYIMRQHLYKHAKLCDTHAAALIDALSHTERHLTLIPYHPPGALQDRKLAGRPTTRHARLSQKPSRNQIVIYTVTPSCEIVCAFFYQVPQGKAAILRAVSRAAARLRPGRRARNLA